jgi:hypothetical protein
MLIALAFLVLLISGGAIGAGAYFTKNNPRDLMAPKPTELRTAYLSCGSTGEISDGDRTLYLDMAGSQDGSGNLSVTQVQCILRALKTPDYVMREMASTRALDGRQSDTWADFSASWSYHPDSGLDVLIRQVNG